jgi:hypothetical protein
MVSLWEEEQAKIENAKEKPVLDHNPSYKSKEEELYYTRERNMHEKYFWQY